MLESLLDKIRWKSDVMDINPNLMCYREKDWGKSVRWNRNEGRLFVCKMTSLAQMCYMFLIGVFPLIGPGEEWFAIIGSVLMLAVVFPMAQPAGTAWFENDWTLFSPHWRKWMISCIPFAFAGWFFGTLSGFCLVMIFGPCSA